MLAPLLDHDPASPRLTVYDEVAGTRMEFSAITLDNWANKIANMLIDEFDLTDSPTSNSADIIIDLPVSWQAAVLPIGVYTAGLQPTIDTAQATDPAQAADPTASPRLVFTTTARAELWIAAGATDIAVVSDDPFGRGVVESGGQLPRGAVDFGPTVRFYGDQFFGPTPELHQWRKPEVTDTPERLLVPSWHTREDFDAYVLAPLAAGGSVVAVTGMASTERIAHIAETEKVTRRV